MRRALTLAAGSLVLVGWQTPSPQSSESTCSTDSVLHELVIDRAEFSCDVHSFTPWPSGPKEDVQVHCFFGTVRPVGADGLESTIQVEVSDYDSDNKAFLGLNQRFCVRSDSLAFHWGGDGQLVYDTRHTRAPIRHLVVVDCPAG